MEPSRPRIPLLHLLLLHFSLLALPCSARWRDDAAASSGASRGGRRQPVAACASTGRRLLPVARCSTPPSRTSASPRRGRPAPRWCSRRSLPTRCAPASSASAPTASPSERAATGTTTRASRTARSGHPATMRGQHVSPSSMSPRSERWGGRGEGRGAH
uniref:Uncharacterized protein n=1 Tax=Oryza meridionalis TaxID=40149 RepID=A0A0E0E0Y3_9ORYZ